MLAGDTNIDTLVQQGCHIWNDWAYKNYVSQQDENLPYLQMSGFKDAIRRDEDFANRFGDLGPIYGKQWRDWNGVDQLQIAVEQIQRTPASRRIIIEGWNVPELFKMALPPCHKTYQFTVRGNKLDLTVQQRSCDMFLGVPFNIANAGLMLALMAKTCDLKADKLHWFGVNCHIYSNHKEQVNTILGRDAPQSLPKLLIEPHVDIFNCTIDDVMIDGYDPNEAIAAPVAV